jgi:hypothetical protein
LPVRVEGSQAAVAGRPVHQRAAGGRAGRDGHRGDLADDNAVIAAVVHGGGQAFQRGQRAVEQRGAGDRTRVVRHPVQLPVERAPSGGQPARGLLVVLGEDGYRP